MSDLQRPRTLNAFRGDLRTGPIKLIPAAWEKGFHIAVLLNESKCFTELKRTHTQTAKWLKSGLIWLVLRYHSGGVWANRLQRNHWLRWVIGPHAWMHRCKKTVTVCGRRTFSQLSGYGGLCISVVVWKNWTYAVGYRRGICNSFFFFSVGEGSVWGVPTLSDCQENRRMGTESVRHNALFVRGGWRLCILIVNCRPTMWFTL